MSRIPTLTRPLSFTSPANMAMDSAVLTPSVVKTGYHLLDIPLSAVSEHSAWTNAGYWQGGFDCALWLRTPQGLAHPVQLAICYQDNQGEKTVLVDRCAAGSYRTVLLNGSIQLGVSGRIRNMGLYLVGVKGTAEVAMEEWHLIPQQKRKLITS